MTQECCPLISNRSQKWRSYLKKIHGHGLANKEHHCTLHKRPMKFLRKLYQQEHCQLGLEETGRVPSEVLTDTKTLLAGRGIIKPLSFSQTYATVREKGRRT